MPTQQSPQTPDDRILEALARFTRRSGSQLAALTGLWTGDLYPALVRLETDKKIIGEWDEGDYPRTRRYRLAE